MAVQRAADLRKAGKVVKFFEVEVDDLEQFGALLTLPHVRLTARDCITSANCIHRSTVLLACLIFATMCDTVGP